jgi:hypothetical protein
MDTGPCRSVPVDELWDDGTARRVAYRVMDEARFARGLFGRLESRRFSGPRWPEANPTGNVRGSERNLQLSLRFYF